MKPEAVTVASMRATASTHASTHRSRRLQQRMTIATSADAENGLRANNFKRLARAI
jgi:hypothetical protein